ncbi:hypothetical protein ABT304_29040 [Nocardioides sp. NPDC000445]|uniref:hypothetical protein n=1 Tax=Nocardioides sp. NPDC000445 TaxID=3154257 RepID=UPI003323249A
METSEALDRAVTELGKFVRDEIAATSVAIGCLRAIATQTLSHIRTSGDHESVRLIDAEVEGFTFVPRITGLNGAQTLLREVSMGGMIHARLTQQLIVTVFTGWDAHHRARIATARGLETDELRSDYFGDLRLLRNDIAHSRGLAKRSVRCAGAVLSRELKTGDLIYLGDDELANLSAKVPYSELIGRE